MTFRPRRTALYMPGSNARALEKARSLGVDVLLLDLEDSVALDMKETAREQVKEAVKAGGFGHREVVIRINGLDTPWGEADLDAALAAGPDAVLVPKVSSAEDVYAVGRRMNDAGADQSIKIWAMLETPGGVLRAAEIAAATQEAISEFEIAGAAPATRAGLLSGGNAQKLVLARELRGDARLLVVHSPTRGLDVRACAAVHRVLMEARDRGAGVVLISEDLDEIFKISDRIGVINRGRIVGEFAAPADRHEVGALMVGHA